jgi:hypothetical protein
VSLLLCPPFNFFYQCQSFTMVRTTGCESLPKTAIPEEFIDLRVIVESDLHGKVKQTRMVILDFKNASLFPQMDIHAFMDCNTLLDGHFQWQWKYEFVWLQESTLISLCDLPVFGTTGEVGRCIKFLISRVHNNTFWLD